MEREISDFREFVLTGKYQSTYNTPNEKRDLRSRYRLVTVSGWCREKQVGLVSGETQQQEVIKEMHEGVSYQQVVGLGILS